MMKTKLTKIVTYVLPGVVDRIATPGAAISTLLFEFANAACSLFSSRAVTLMTAL